MTAPSGRRRLPNRRLSVTYYLSIDGQTFAVSVGYFVDGSPGEIFIRGAKTGSAMDAVLADAGILASLALQHGTPPDALARSMSRLPSNPWRPATAPASPVAAAMDLVARLSATPGVEAQQKEPVR